MIKAMDSGEAGGFTMRRFGPFDPGPHPCAKPHRHYIDHLTYIETGAVKCVVERPDGSGAERVVHAGRFILMPANDLHTFWALEPQTKWLCLFAEAEAVKLLDQKRIREAIEKLEKHGEDASGLRSMLIECEIPDEIDPIIQNYARASDVVRV